jgi:hypothetical protein
MQTRAVASLCARIVLASGLLLTGCKDKAKGAAPAAVTSVAASAAAAPSGAVAAPEESAPWFVGTWSGTYQSRHHLIQMDRKDGAVRAWAEDKGQTGSGTGKLTLRIDDSRAVRGGGTGPLGELVASGELDGEVLRVRLIPKDPAAESSFAGFLIAKRVTSGFEGSIQASTGDGATVRDAPVRLTLGDGDAAQPGRVAPTSTQ